jgi:hypothetical protein
MTSSSDTKQPSSDPFDPRNLRLSQDFGASVAVKKAVITIPVRKPDRQWFVRVRPGNDWRLPVAIIDVTEERDPYVVAPSLVADLTAEVAPSMLFTAISRHAGLFLWPIRLPGEDGTHNPWHRSAWEAAARAESHWVRVVANKSAGAYDVYEATGNLGEPEWPTPSFAELLKIAFRDRFIDSSEHPVLRRLRGEV